MKRTYSLAIHGGAGTIRKEKLTSELERAFREALSFALEAGEKVLDKGGTALDAVEASVICLENEVLFNAGRGAVFNESGLHELEASIMDGKSRGAGGVGGMAEIANPISLARKVMEESPHVLLMGEGARQFAQRMGFEEKPLSYFHSDHRHGQWKRAQQRQKIQLDHSDDKMGTVGAVARDPDGNLAAATSTGGMTNKWLGRVGDTPLIGSGTYADNHTCAVSCTGHGEFFIRGVTAYDVAALMDYGNKSLREAADFVILEKQVKLGGSGGLIAVDSLGNVATPFNTSGMYRAWSLSGQKEIHIF